MSDRAQIRKRAMDYLQEALGCDPESATHQHHAPPPDYQSGMAQKGTELDSNHTQQITIPPQDIRASAVETDPKLRPPESVEDATFFKESDPEMRPVEEEIAKHEFFKEAPEFEARRAEGRQAASISVRGARARKLYHVTATSNVPSIREKGILPMQTSNWIKGEGGERYGGGEIFAFEKPEDAVRWAGKMDWDFNQGIGTGKISVVSFRPGEEKWEEDTADPMAQAISKGKWLKSYQRVKPEQVIGSTPVTSDLTKALTQGKPVKLAAGKQEFEALRDRWKAFYKKTMVNDRGALSLDRKKIEAAIPTVSEFAKKLHEFMAKSPESGLFEDAFIEFGSVKPVLAEALQRLKLTEETLAASSRFFASEFKAAMSLMDTAFHNLGVEYHYLEKDRNQPYMGMAIGSKAAAEAHGNVPDPGEGRYDLRHEAHIRKEAHDWSQYAEEPDNTEKIKPFDPSGCYDDATRVLTKAGFKHFYELVPSDEVATLVHGEELVYEKPIASTRYWYEGPMYRFNQRHIDLFITPTHKVYWRNGHSNQHRLVVGKPQIEFELTEVKDVPCWTNAQFKRNAGWHCAPAPDVFQVPALPISPIVTKYEAWQKWDGRIKEFVEQQHVSRATVHRWKTGETDPRNMYASPASSFSFDDWLEFLGWYLSEGSTAPKDGRVTISQNKPNNRKLIVSLLGRMGIVFYTDKDGFNFYHRPLCEYLTQFGLAPDKFIPQGIKELDPSKLQIILGSLMAGDGSWRKAQQTGRYPSVSRRLAEDVAEIALKCGYGICLKSRKPSTGKIVGRLPLHVVHLTKASLTPKCGKPEIINFKGWVSCVQVSSGIIFVERNGKSCWSGNSYLCGTCDMRREPDKCARVEGDINMAEGGCKLYHLGAPESDPPMKQKFSKEEASYGEHKGGFGCHRCEYGSKAGAPDEEGRESWCSFWGMHIVPNACCAEWEAGKASKEAAVTKSYGMDTPLGGAINDPRQDNEEEEEAATEKTAAEECKGCNEPLNNAEGEYCPACLAQQAEDRDDPFDEAAAEKMAAEIAEEEARIASEVATEDSRSMSKAASLAMRLDFSPLDVASRRIAFTDNAGWWSKSARPTEQKIELLQKQFKLTPEQVELAIAADPSPNQSDYVAWIAKWMSKGQIRLPEDTAKIKEQLATFTKLKRSPNFTHNKDIQQYDPGKLFEVLESSSSAAAPALSKKEQERETIAKGAKVVVQDGELTIYKVTDPKALALLSGGTNWCTAQESMGEHYLSKGPSYVFFEGKHAFAQFHPSTNQLMNRQDVCMLEKVYEEGARSTGWGRSYRRPSPIATFIADPVLLEGLQKLAAIEPDVREWVEENTSSQEQLLEILGEKAEEEAERNKRIEEGRGYYYDSEPRWSMTVRHALAAGKPLSPEIEAKLSVVGTDLLFKYGSKFHAGQPWQPLADAILKQRGVSKEIVSYATKFVRGRWPEGEAKLLKGAFLRTYESGNMKLALEYCQRVIKGRWPELEAKFHKAKPSEASGYGSAEYAISILKQRWATVPGIKPRRDGKINEEQIIIIGAPEEAARYAEAFMPGQPWPEFEEASLAASHITALTDYTAEVLKRRNPALEEAILGGQHDKVKHRWRESKDQALYYAEKVIKGRWSEYEQRILDYMKKTDNGDNHQKFESVLQRPAYSRYGHRLPATVHDYIEDIIKGRWPELEQVLLGRYQEHPAQWNTNQIWLEGYLALLGEICDKQQGRDKYTEESDTFEQRAQQLMDGGMSFEEATRQAEKEKREGRQYTKFKNEQCHWAEGEKRLKTRDLGYERFLIEQARKQGEEWRQDKSEKLTYKGDAGYETDYEGRERLAWLKNPETGIWVSHYGNDVKNYVYFMDDMGQHWPEGESLTGTIEEVDKGYWAAIGIGSHEKRRFLKEQPEPQAVQSSLLRKADLGMRGVPHTKEPAAIKMRETTTVLPPRDDARKHKLVEEEREMRNEIRKDVRVPLNPRLPRPKQIDPNIQINASSPENDIIKVTPAEVVPKRKAQLLRKADAMQPDAIDNPEAEFDRTFGFLRNELKWKGPPFYPPAYPWIMVYVNNNGWQLWNATMQETMARGKTMEELKEELRALVKDRHLDPRKLVDYDPRTIELPGLLKKGGKREEEEQALLQAFAAEEAAAKEAFMREPYLLQEAQDRNCAMEELWQEIGKNYANAYFAAQRSRVPQNWLAPR